MIDRPVPCRLKKVPLAQRLAAHSVVAALLGTCALSGMEPVLAQSALQRAPEVGSAVQVHPNVLLILIDDLKPAIHGYGNPVAVTPNMDRLIARGTRFDLAYANQAVCAPSRSRSPTHYVATRS
jgi:iduronate 2-sulfatase